MIGRLVSNRYGATVLGVILVLIGIFGFSSDEVTCGGRTMEPGDSCVETRKGQSTTRSYEEEKSRDHLYRIGFIGVGALMFVIGTGLIIKRHAGGSRAVQPAAAPAGGQPPYPPQQQYPQQPYPPQQQYPQQPYPPQQQYPQQPYPPQQQVQQPQQAQYPPMQYGPPQQ